MSMKQVGKALIGAAVMVLWGLAPGCGPSAGSYCNKVCDCLGCDESERADCIDSVDDARKGAERAQCSSEFDDYLSCFNGELTCVDDAIDADGCETEAEALSQCGGPVILGGNACERLYATAEAKYEECGVDFPGGEQPECTGEQAAQAQCFQPCYQDLDCVLLTDPDSPEGTAASNEFGDCVTSCF